jgi:hypothetical protein
MQELLDTGGTVQAAPFYQSIKTSLKSVVRTSCRCSACGGDCKTF